MKLEVLWQRVHMDILTYKDNSKFEMGLIEKKLFKWGWGEGVLDSFYFFGHFNSKCTKHRVFFLILQDEH